jgi:hypothetical protein
LKQVFQVLLICAGVTFLAQGVAGQPVMRIKAKLTAFDGQTMTLEPVSSSKDQAALLVSVTSKTRYVGSNQASFAAIKRGDYVGAAVVEQRDAGLRAQEVFLYADVLRGSGEGRFPDGDRLMVNGTVSAVKPGERDRQDNVLTLHYHGAELSGRGAGKTVCEGRASLPVYASALACEADAVIAVAPSTPVSALEEGNASLLVPGSLVTVAMTKTDGDKNVGLGVVVEKMVTVEKPQSAP